MDKTVRIWNVETGEEQASFIGHDRYIVRVAWTPDGQNVISGLRQYDQDLERERGPRLHKINGL